MRTRLMNWGLCFIASAAIAAAIVTVLTWLGDGPGLAG
jgi:hypothetical protein